MCKTVPMTTFVQEMKKSGVHQNAHINYRSYILCKKEVYKSEYDLNHCVYVNNPKQPSQKSALWIIMFLNILFVISNCILYSQLIDWLSEIPMSYNILHKAFHCLLSVALYFDFFAVIDQVKTGYYKKN